MTDLTFLMNKFPNVYMCPLRKKCTYSSWGNDKMCIFGSIENLQRMLNEIKWWYSQNKDLGGKWYCQTWKAFRIISSEIKILSLILIWWYFSCLQIQIIFFTYELKIFFQIFKCKVCRSADKITLYLLKMIFCFSILSDLWNLLKCMDSMFYG